jgi:hypothetical protein
MSLPVGSYTLCLRHGGPGHVVFCLSISCEVACVRIEAFCRLRDALNVAYSFVAISALMHGRGPFRDSFMNFLRSIHLSPAVRAGHVFRCLLTVSC